MLTYCQLKLKEHKLVKFERKYHLQNTDRFVQDSIYKLICL